MFFTGRTLQTAALKLIDVAYTLFLVSLSTTNVDLISDFLPMSQPRLTTRTLAPKRYKY